jgi:hypothetical protein
MARTVRRAATATVALLVLLASGVADAASPAETSLLDMVNGARAAHGKAPLAWYWDLADDAKSHSAAMMSAGQIYHNPDLGSVTTGWTVLAENVGVSGDAEGVFDAFMDSPTHRANILGDFEYIGIGAAESAGLIWATMIFMKGDFVPLPFADIEDSIFLEDILWLTQDGSRFACNPPIGDLFCPTAPVEREWMAEFVAVTLDLPAATIDYFVDDGDSLFEDSINRVARAGISFGCNPPSNTHFCPDRILNRGEMAAFFVRALALANGGAGDYFTDDDDSVFESDIDKVAAAGISFGCNPPSNTMYCLERILNRGEISAFLQRALD